MIRVRTLLACSALLFIGCGHPSEEVSQDPPPRLATQSSDLPPQDFIDADLLARRRGKLRTYCFGVDELLSWLVREKVTEQKWTLLADGRWRLDGFDPRNKEHTVWVFEQSEKGVELVEYKDSDKVSRTHETIMEIYYPHLSRMHSDPIRKQYGGCRNPYD